MNSDDNKNAKPTSSDEFSVNPLDDSKENNEPKQERHSYKRSYEYSEEEMVRSPRQEEVPSKRRRIATPSDEDGQTSRVEATYQMPLDANIPDASETEMFTPSYEELLLALLDLHDEVEARKKESAENACKKRSKDGDSSDADSDDLF